MLFLFFVHVAVLSKQQHFLSLDMLLIFPSFLGIMMEIFFKLLTPSLNNHTVLRVSKMSKRVVESLEINRWEESSLYQQYTATRRFILNISVFHMQLNRIFNCASYQCFVKSFVLEF